MNTTPVREAPISIRSDDRLFAEFVEGGLALEDLGAEWDALYAQCLRPSPCASHAWAVAWWRAYGNDPQGAGLETHPLVVAVREAGGRLVGIVPFVEDRPSRPTRLRRLRIMGFVGQDGVFDMTEEPSLLIRGGWEDRVLAVLAEAFDPGLRSGRWDAINLRIHAGANARPLQNAFSRQLLSANVKVDVRAGSDYALMPDAWVAYRKLLTKSMRDNLGYYPRLLTRDGHDWQVRMLRAPDEMADAAARLVALHVARADSEKGRRHDCHLQGPVQEAFLRDLLERFAQRGEATIAELVVGGEVVASQAFVESGDTMTVYYSGFNEAWYKFSPIFVIDAVVFRDAQERGIRRLDFLRNPALWKTRWGAEPGLPMHRALVVSRRPDSRLRFGLFWVDQLLKRNVRDRLPILAREATTRLSTLRTSFGRAVLPALPMLGRVGMRAMPTLHWAVVQAPLHHR